MSEKLSPLVSIIFPVFEEDDELLRLAFDSIVFQTYSNIEILIIDDSVSSAKKIYLDRLVQQDRRAKIIRPLSKRGLASAINVGIQQSKGVYIARVDSDDIQIPTRIEQQVEYMKLNPMCGVLGGACLKIDSQGTGYGIKVYPERHTQIQKKMCVSNAICHPTVMLRRSLVEKFGYYDESYKKAEDYEFWVRLISNGVKFYNLQTPLIQYRMADSTRRDQDNWRFNLRVKTKYFAANNISLRVFGILIVSIIYCSPEWICRILYKKYAENY